MLHNSILQRVHFGCDIKEVWVYTLTIIDSQPDGYDQGIIISLFPVCSRVSD